MIQRKSIINIRTIRDIADNMGMPYVSALFTDSLVKGQTFNFMGKQYQVTIVSNKKVSFKCENGNAITALNFGNNFVSAGGRKTANAYSNFSRDLEGLIMVDLLNENNKFHEKSEAFQIIQKAIDNLPDHIKNNVKVDDYVFYS